MTAHRLLARQLRRLGIADLPDREQWAAVLEVVARTYAEVDDERYLLERSIDISSREMRGLHDELRRQAHQDPLTGLPNRAALVGRLERALARARDGGPGVSVLFFDLDGFKAVNDRRGHAAGDELLVRVGHRVRACLRADDVLGRLGGDEFVVVGADGGDRAGATSLAARVVEAVAVPFELTSGAVRVTASVGVAVTGTGRDTADGVLHRADEAMYRAKAAGGGRWTLGGPAELLPG
ncbi:diguanylate cyclase (GGDEF) domain-containing protein [Klenkia soli]|uniref:Diguanylate cyclase (GGDEF) domain-containing protein n=1 Tax=Klenkia soli TaxID=1052260 RepID=A0A1H0TD58_9ACTN|nr:GGDEF domain-containing protein [Klenkia soli]SDP51983.1 diguanylate cyclase (GGDEF) domain-containing protein [Klenkia soli]